MTSYRGKKYCSVFGCFNKDSLSPDLSFFSIPTEQEQRIAWLKVIDREDLSHQSRPDARVCEAHFKTEDISVNTKRKRLRKNCLPCLRLPTKNNSKDTQTQTTDNASSQIDLPTSSVSDQTEKINDTTTMPLLQDPSTILEFVKIVGRFPDIYDSSSETYKKFGADKSWPLVVDCLKNEMDLDTTVEELKLKWKGIRSSYSRYKSKLYYNKSSTNPPKKYYLWDALSFLDPFTKTKSIPDKMNESYFEECEIDNNGEDFANSSDYDPTTFEWPEVEVKPDITKIGDQLSDSDEQPLQNTFSKSRKRKHEDTSDGEGDMNFFRSILPDLANFSAKERRTLKIGVLELINKIENDRNK